MGSHRSKASSANKSGDTEYRLTPAQLDLLEEYRSAAERVARKIARRGYAAYANDARQTAVLCLIELIKKYDPSRGELGAFLCSNLYMKTLRAVRKQVHGQQKWTDNVPKFVPFVAKLVRSDQPATEAKIDLDVIFKRAGLTKRESSCLLDYFIRRETLDWLSETHDYPNASVCRRHLKWAVQKIAEYLGTPSLTLDSLRERLYAGAA